MRSIWNGVLSFGLVNIPVKVYPAVEEKDFSFRLLHRQCNTPITYAKRCPVCGVDVGVDDIVRGYEFARGQFVVVTQEELSSLPLPTTRAIEISDFVSLEEIDPLYFSRPYYLAPEDGGQKAYALLHRAMADTKRVAVAKVTLRQRESLACVRVYRRALVLETMLYADEIRRPENLPEVTYTETLDPRELEMAKKLVESLSAPFEPEKYRDGYRQALEELISSKIAGRQVVAPPAPAPAKVVDLMEALRASIEQAEKKRPSAARAGRTGSERASARGRKTATATGKR
ncbi:MAG: Ku protein [Moorellales bacterium]